MAEHPAAPHDRWNLCNDCGSPAMAFAPGADPVTAPGGIIITRGIPARAWCERHWPFAPRPTTVKDRPA